jgi:repressor LexA
MLSIIALRVHGDSMNAAGVDDGDTVIVRHQTDTDPEQIAVVQVNDQDATIKYVRRDEDAVTLLPKSKNPMHQPQFYDLRKVKVEIVGRVVEVRKKI